MGTNVYLVIMLVVLVVLGAIAATVFGLRRKIRATDPRHPQGYYVALSLSFGLAGGALLALLADLLTSGDSSWLAIGPAMGLPIGAAVGVALEQRHQDELRPLGAEEKRLKKAALWVALGALLLILSLTVATLLMR